MELTYLRQLLTALNITCVIDVGANRGQFALDLRSIGFSGKIVSFEPVASVYEELTAVMGRDANWQGFNFALGSENGTMQINVGKNSQLSSLNDFREAEHMERVETIEIRRLDSMWDSIFNDHSEDRFFLKMDTQGFDHEVFAGAEGCIDRFQGLMSEVTLIPLYKSTPRYLESLAMFEKAGFSVCSLTPVFRKPSLEVVEFNCMMRRTRTTA
ncbi:MAG: FkbM family methyltransferase [Pyrinomonadaceae bacterium]